MSEQRAVDLSGTWRLRDETSEYECLLDLPGDGITALHRAGLVPDPYWGRNEYDLRWVAERDWTASRTIELSGPGVELVVSGLDTVATIRWNGTVVLQAQNVHRTYRVDLSAIARAGSNTVEIVFHSPVRAGRRRQAEQPFYVPSMNDHPEMGAQCPIPNGNMLRKQQCDFGWDWNIALAPFGLVGSLRLEPVRAARIDRIAVRQEHEGGLVRLSLQAACANAEGETAHFHFGDETAEAAVVNGMAAATFTLHEPALWWPAGQGEQTLYDLTVTVGTARARRRIGLRTIELVTEPDEHGASFKLRVNGRNVFAKGSNWIPADALSGRITAERTRGLLESAAAANMNMVRVWGGGRYETDTFYDACDELGLLVWQDCMFSCSLYPSTPDFLHEVDGEVRENVARLHHHASVALWCGDNELVGALDWFEISRQNRDRYLVSYDRLNRTIERAVRETDPGANWWPSSPSLGPMDFRDGWHVEGQGDMHFWSVWHEGEDFDAYRAVAPRFCSEFGFQSYPSVNVIRRFADPADWNIASPVLESHQKNPGGNARIAETMFRLFRWPERFEDFVWLSQVQQALAIKTAVTHWRGLKPHCMGTLYWQLNDTWPVCSWSSLNHGGEWKLLHHFAREFYAPTTVVCMPEDEAYVLRGVNDRPEPVAIKLRADALGMDGTRRTLGEAEGMINEHAVELLRIDRTTLADNEMLVFEWEGPSGVRGRDHFAPKPYKAYEIASSQLLLHRDGTNLTMVAERPAFFATVEADVSGRFSRNGVLLLPDEAVTVTFQPDDPAAMPDFTVRDLYSATVERVS